MSQDPLTERTKYERHCLRTLCPPTNGRALRKQSVSILNSLEFLLKRRTLALSDACRNRDIAILPYYHITLEEETMNSERFSYRVFSPSASFRRQFPEMIAAYKLAQSTQCWLR